MLNAVLLSLATLFAQEPAKPNFVFIMADDLGYGDLGCYGQKKILTPELDRMASQGIRFSQYYAGSTVCAPSRCVLMTGKHLGHCTVRGNGRGLAQCLRPEDITIAEALKQAGYRTGHFGKWGLGDEGEAIVGVPTRQGFDSFFGYLNQHHAHNYWPPFLIEGEKRFPLPNEVKQVGGEGGGIATKKVVYAPDLILDRALTFLEQNKQGPFFLYFSSILPHANNEANRLTGNGCEVPDLGIYKNLPWSEQNKAQAAMVSYLDTQVGKVLAKLKQLNLEKNTLVVFTSDNGPHREGGNQPEFFQASGPFQGIKRSLHDGGIRVPMIARWPGTIVPGKTSSHISYHGDWLATFCDLAGVETPANTDSLSMKPTLLGQGKQTEHPFLYWEFYEGKGARALRQGNWKVVQTPLGGKLKLFDLSKDEGEKTDLADEQKEVASRLANLMRQAHQDSKHWKFNP